MIALLLAVALTHPTTPEAACDAHELQAVVATTKNDWPTWQMELDRRFALVLAAERETDAQALPSGARKPFTAPAAVVLIGLVLLSIAVGKRSRALAVLGAAGCLVGAWLALRVVDGDREARARSVELRDCRIRIMQARQDVQHGALSRCLSDMAEADEDLMVWEARLKMQQPVTVADVEKLRGEMKPR